MTGTSKPGSVRAPSRVVFWGIALALTLLAAYYQRKTGPTHPVSGEIRLDGAAREYELPRTWVTGEGAIVSLPDPGEKITGQLVHRRYPTDEPFTRTPLVREEGRLTGRLPTQPPAGKVEYHVILAGPDASARLPESPDDDPILRYKGAVPARVLVPHIALVFLALLVGVRAALAAALHPRGIRRLAWVTLGFMTVGGMIFGPIVQKHAFGAYWTGFPNGYDLTDNKMLVMWLSWLVACAVVGMRPRRRDGPGRLAVAAATVVMLVVYLIPHSLRGSELSYEKLDEGVSPTEAVETG